MDEEPENKNKTSTESRTSKKVENTAEFNKLKDCDNTKNEDNEDAVSDNEQGISGAGELSSCSDEDESEDEWTNDDDYGDSDEEWTGDDYHDMNNVIKKKVKNKKDTAQLEPIVIPGAMTSDGATSDYEKIRENNIKAREDLLVKLMADIHLYKQDTGLATPSKTVFRKDVSLKVTPAASRRKVTLSKGKGPIKIGAPGQAPSTHFKKTLISGKSFYSPVIQKLKKKTKSHGNTGSVTKTPPKKCSSQSDQVTTDFTDVLQKIRRRRQNK